MFFKTVQNKIHFAVSGHTAAEIVYLRADSSKPFMGLTTFQGDKPKRSDVGTAKNYLSEQELKELNVIVSAYLDFAELQAIRKKPMYMKDWARKLDDFLKMSESELLQNAGMVSHEDALSKAKLEYDKYKQLCADDLSKKHKNKSAINN